MTARTKPQTIRWLHELMKNNRAAFRTRTSFPERTTWLRWHNRQVIPDSFDVTFCFLEPRSLHLRRMDASAQKQLFVDWLSVMWIGGYKFLSSRRVDVANAITYAVRLCILREFSATSGTPLGWVMWQHFSLSARSYLSKLGPYT